MTDEISKFIIGALRQMKFPAAALKGESSLGPAGLDLESLAVADLMVQIEHRYGVKVDEDEMERFAMMTIDEIASEVSLKCDF